MARVYDVRLELVRPGPPHNQLLSPLTPYMALCGEGSPVTFHIEFEHRQLLNRLERLRYVAPDSRGQMGVIPDELRQAQVQELGEDMGRVLAHITTLGTELARARASGSAEAPFIHLRLVLSGSELAILPFELARAPQAFPGEGLDLFLQASLPVVVTRESRRTGLSSDSSSWAGRDPRVLFVYAAPDGLTVPMKEHLRALREALDPWISWSGEQPGMTSAASAQCRLGSVKEQLRVLVDASVDEIYDRCASESFTHVHILAHGDVFEDAGEQRFGVALHRKGTREKQVIGGRQLAQALRAESVNGAKRSEPLVVTLAMCDSGQQGSVLVPGGSIAHDLHSEGIPWVFASQFPLTKPGSIRLTQLLYPRLLRGDDPRQVLFELRRRLSMTAEGDHDWASLVTYASPTPDLEDQVAQFFERQTRRAIEVQMARADRLVAAIRELKNKSKEPTEAPKVPSPPDETSAKVEDPDSTKRRTYELIKQILGNAREWLDRWESRLPNKGQTIEDRMARTNCFGMQGSTYKRMGLLYASIKDAHTAEEKLKAALDAYRRGMDEWVTEDARFSWTASQYLALAAVLDPKKTGTTSEDVYTVCSRLAERDLQSGDRELKAWAHGTLAELELISSYYEQSATAESSRAAVLAHCRHIVDLKGPESFHAESTRRQMQRYVDKWGLKSAWPFPQWSEIAGEAVKVLRGEGEESGPHR
jgi:hypothetical protein